MRILAIGANFEDIQAGCGATLAKAAARGHEIRLALLRPDDPAATERLTRDMRAYGPHMVLTDRSGPEVPIWDGGRGRAAILRYEPTPTGEPFRPQIYVDVAGYMDRKLATLRGRPGRPGRREAWLAAVAGRALRRGLEAGCEAAEAYEAVRLGLTI